MMESCVPCVPSRTRCSASARYNSTRGKRHFTAPAILQKKFTLESLGVRPFIEPLFFLFPPFPGPVSIPEGSVPLFSSGFSFVFVDRQSHTSFHKSPGRKAGQGLFFNRRLFNCRASQSIIKGNLPFKVFCNRKFEDLAGLRFDNKNIATEALLPAGDILNIFQRDLKLIIALRKVNKSPNGYDFGKFMPGVNEPTVCQDPAPFCTLKALLPCLQDLP